MNGLRRAAMQKVVRETTVETLGRVGREGEDRRAVGTAAQRVGAAGDGLVDAAAIPRRNVLHVGGIFEPPLDFERRHAGINHFLDAVGAVHIAQRKQVLVAGEDNAVGIYQVESEAAELRASAAVGRTPEAILRGIAPPAVTHAERTVHKGFEGYADRLRNLFNLRE